MVLYSINSLFSFYKTNKPNGNFNLEITPAQLLFLFSDDIESVFIGFQNIPQRFKLNFAKRILSFLKQYEFIDRNDIEVNNRHKIVIAAIYVMLTLGFSTFLINSFSKIIIYPSAHYFPDLDETHIGHFNPKYKAIMFSLDEILKTQDKNWNKNIALHEFTHALCFELLQKKSKHPYEYYFKKYYYLIVRWFADKKNLEEIQQANFLRDYAFTNKLELISVLVETFFLNGANFKIQFPLLYNLVGGLLNHPKSNK